MAAAIDLKGFGGAELKVNSSVGVRVTIKTEPSVESQPSPGTGQAA